MARRFWAQPFRRVLHHPADVKARTAGNPVCGAGSRLRQVDAAAGAEAIMKSVRIAGCG